MPGPVSVDGLDVSPRDLLGALRVERPKAPMAERVTVLSAGSPLRGLLPPRIEFGKVQTQQVAWYKVSFARPFRSPPTLQVTPEHRPGWFEDLVLPPPLLDKGQVANLVGGAMRDNVVRAVNIPVIGDALGALAFAIGFVTGYIFAFILNIVTPYLASLSQLALNASPALLYAHSDRPLMKLTTAEIRNITASSFELLGVPNGTFHLVAIGER